ncbi:hypothetical protein AC578_10080 [Pseudocercospora eumusae]|uniref:Uncharacterized protein n=1 Tax=Pseudocercospora eumusae TaxID=321146 RepID=A0A139H8C1_9PEZI|nr:hypothetical protein AC578_10080 [Pseudocercospora eumusae]
MPAPLTNRLKSLAKNTAGPAISSGSATLPNGVLRSRYSNFPKFFKSSTASPVRVVPGSKALQRIPNFPNAHAWLCIMLRTAAFVGV